MKSKYFWPIFLFLTAFTICAVVFINVLPVLSVLQAPDAMPSFGKTSLFRRMLPWMNGTQAMITHDDLLKVFPALIYHELSFIISTALLALAMGTYLRTIGLPLTACFGGGLAMAFSGYHFTLFNAGHRGYFIMMPYAIFLFALVERAIQTPRWFYFALMSVCVIAGLSTQPDVLLLILLFLAVYTLIRFIMIVAETGVKSYLTTRWVKHLFGLLVLIVTFAAIGYRTVEHVLTETIAGREKQIEQSAQASKAADNENDTAGDVKTKNPRWVFATNWSLPPEALAEFVAPCLRGLDTGNPRAPYWGRLGQSIDWAENQQSFRNFRQHTLYLGAIQIGMALFAVLVAVWPCSRKQKKNDDTPLRMRDPLNALTYFWLITGIVTIMLALGRYAPFYQYFYSLPQMDKIRAPVKFVHITEMAVSILFAIGLARLLQAQKKMEHSRIRKIAVTTMIVLGIGAVACVIARLAFNTEGTAAIWSAMNIPAATIQETLARLFKGALMRAAWMLALVAAALGLSLLPKTDIRTRAALPCVLLLIAAVVLDMAEIGRRYVVIKDITYVSQPNPIARTFMQREPIDGRAYSYIQLTNQLLPGQTPFLQSLSINGLACMDPLATDQPGNFRVRSFYALQNDLTKRWKFWGTTAVLTTPQMAKEMIQANLVKIVGLYDLDKNWRLVSPKNLTSAQIAVVEPVDIIPSIAVFHSWRIAEKKDALDVIAQADFDLDREIVISGENIEPRTSNRTYTPAKWVASPHETKGNRAEITIHTEEAGILMIRENSLRHVPVTARVNGEPAPIHTVNGHSLGIPVKAGTSTVTIRPTVSATATAGTVAGLAFALFAVVSLLKHEFSNGNNPEPTHV